MSHCRIQRVHLCIEGKPQSGIKGGVPADIDIFRRQPDRAQIESNMFSKADVRSFRPDIRMSVSQSGPCGIKCQAGQCKAAGTIFLKNIYGSVFQHDIHAGQLGRP